MKTVLEYAIMIVVAFVALILLYWGLGMFVANVLSQLKGVLQ